MLYAARAALSERELNAKTHRGIWNLFDTEIEQSGAVEPGLAAQGRHAQRLRERADYEGEDFEPEDAAAAIADAEHCLDAVEALLGAG